MPLRLSYPYPTSPGDGFWGAKTSAVNFCEEDYIFSHYIAEFVNTFTSLAYIGYGIYGIHRSHRQSIGPLSAVNLPYFALIGVGFFSGLYHMTLKYQTQNGDEMSMHTAMACVLIRIFSYGQPPEVQLRRSAFIAIGLTSFIVYHCLTNEFVLHVILFFGLSVTVSRKTRTIIQQRKDSEAEKKKLLSLVFMATYTALFAFGIWNIDMHFCGPLTRWKRQIGLPWGILFELHGWWHILTAISCYAFMALIEFLTDERKGDEAPLDFAWPAKTPLRRVGARDLAQNGKAR